MRTINQMEQQLVSGSGDDGKTSIVERGVELCKGMPDEKKVTITLDHEDSLGLSSTGGSKTETITFEISCGDLRKAADSKS